MRGGIATISKRHAVANNPDVEGYDPTQPNRYITYLDANSLPLHRASHCRSAISAF